MKLGSMLIAVAVSACVVTSSFAADTSKPREWKNAFDKSSAYNWTGFYAGINFGRGFGATLDQRYDSIYSTSSTVDRYSGGSGNVVGGQFGYSGYVAPNLIFGIETDVQWSNIISSVTLSPCPGCLYPYTLTNTKQLRWLGTTVGRLAYANNAWLIGVLGGAAYGGVDQTQTYTDAFGSSWYKTMTPGVGFTVGGFVEYGIMRDVSIKVQYNYVGLYLGGSKSSSDSSSNEYSTHLVRAGINKRF